MSPHGQQHQQQEGHQRPGLTLVETEKDRRIRLGLLTPFDRLAGFERKHRAAGFGSLRHLGRPELRPEEAAALTRSGRPVGQVIAEAGRVALEARTSRRMAQFLEPEQLPQQERDVRRVPQHFWRQAASSHSAGGTSRLRRKSTLPRANTAEARAAARAARRAERRTVAAAAAAIGGSVAGGDGSEGAGDGGGSDGIRRRENERRKGGRRREEEVGGEDEEGEREGEGQRRRRRRTTRSGQAAGGGEAGVHPGVAGGGGGGSGGDAEASASVTSSAESAGEGEDHSNFSDELADGGSSGSESYGGTSCSAAAADDDDEGDSEVGAAGDRGDPSSYDDSLYDDADEDFYQERLRRSRAAAAAASAGGGGGHGAMHSSAAAAAASGPPRQRRRRQRQRQTAGYAHLRNGDPDERQHEQHLGEGPKVPAEEEEEEEEEEDVVFEGGFRVPSRLYGRLFDYQQTAVKWLWELHTQRAGGILGDEMGLGKTVQVIAYLAGLHHSGLYRPSLIVCPATVLRQWMRELRSWWPPFRVVLLHESGRSPPAAATAVRPDRPALLEVALSSPSGLVLTTYDNLRLQRDLLLRVRWGVAVLDEGHKIRNPDSEITLVCKQLHTVHRLIMSGSPIQNRLSELWSLFDFIFPGKLGTLPVFQAQFAVPIQVGGYSNASSLQVTTAYKCAVVLRDLTAPYLLRRRKADVAAQLPAKMEQVLFCTLVSEQLELYRAYLASTEVGEILEGSRRALCGIDILRKICNHPDLLERVTAQDAEDYGNPARSGKLRVAERVLTSWHTARQKALLFCQTQQMLDILEKLVAGRGWSYHRMDGGTPVAVRPRLIDDFNTNPDVFVFLLTTKVGGLGVNLTGATRVMLYDPDWNPSTDIQARERAWRIGQSHSVTIYRLITAGTIEEKIYHRQIYKSFLTNKVLRDPRQKRFFTARDISELFVLGPEYRKGASAAAAAAAGGDGGGGTGSLVDTETARIFGATLDMQDALRGGGSGGGGGSGKNRKGLSSTAAAAAALRRRGERDGEDGDGSGGGAATTAAPSGPGPGLSSRCPHQGPDGGSAQRAGWGRSSAAGQSAAAAAGGGAYDAGDEDEVHDGGGGAEADESRVLRELLDGGAGIRGLVDHSKIEGANDPEVIAVHAEAQRVAQRAAEALRRSRLACAAASIATPTWTGRHGRAGAPQLATAAAAPSPPWGGGTCRTQPAQAQPRQQQQQQQQQQRGVESSAALLAQIRSRQQDIRSAAAAASRGADATAGASTSTSGRSHGGGDCSSAGGTAAERLAGELVSFLEEHGGLVGSEELVEAFRSRVVSEQMPLFKQVLRQVAGLRRRAGGGEWVLKPAFATARVPAGLGGGEVASGVAQAQNLLAKMAVQISKKRKFVADGVFYAELNELLTRELAEDGYSGVEVRVTPMRTEIIIRATRTQNVLGEKGRRIRELTSVVQKRFNFPADSVELYAEKVLDRGLCAVAQAESLRYKLLGGLAVRRACYGVLRFVMESGAKGCEVIVSGKLRAARAKSMKFKDGYMVSSGNPAKVYIDAAVRHVLLRQGVLGIKVKIMKDWDPTGKRGPRTPLPDVVKVLEPKEEEIFQEKPHIGKEDM
ncbi:hypothetical protein VOLCADRAFT_120230 [Volvox carteri f. nagariensis]|uniref:30S ribosomal protein S3, chloroplastic n=1 Tax=Volvox carteri f. nagariensis TaxID=3068 RepID=D8TIE9_VOLCA|nr:uncharacterized protein VOLCADRAFT_120230 [Volvox carteri f. nagariensis]EFJ53228.1 hypothetical protein VOLCADRAFT_120230 [Volvox carteri f. nagariensis]|eukprot:XP_002946233.1 hypothetical protein VOLCADRAFT_120230 [Volvox carteri f. nagariensis]